MIQTEIQDSKALQYAKWCIEPDNHKVGKYIKKQAQDWIDIVNGNSSEAFISEPTYDMISKILKLMVHPDKNCSMYDGLEDYTWFFITAIFCTKLKHAGIEDIRYYTTGLLEISRRNFKTFTSAIIFIICMLTEPRFSRLFSVAPDLRISSELQILVKKIITASPLLADDKIFKSLRKEIRCVLTDSVYTPLAYSEDRMDSSTANVFLCDEAAALENSYPVEAMRSSQILLNSKLGIIISTQYPSNKNVLVDEIDISKKVLDKVEDPDLDRRRFSLLYEPDEELLSNDQWKTNDLIIYQSNPVAIIYEHVFKAIKANRAMAILYPNKRENYLCKHNNIKYKSLGVETYIEIDKVKRCSIKEDLDFWKGKKVYLGLDLSLTDDNTSVAMVCEDNGNIYAKVWGFIPADNVDAKIKKEDLDYNKLIDDGVCFACGNEVISYLFVEDFICKIEETYGVEIESIGYDRHNAISTVQKLEEKDYYCVMVRQHSDTLHMPTKLLKEAVLSQHFKYDENRLLEANFENARCTENTTLDKYVDKKRSKGKVDMVVGIITALYLLQQDVLFGDFVCQTS